LEAVAGELARREVPLEGLHFFWADERCVPADHRESNYALARRALFDPLGIADSVVHRIRGEDLPAEAAVAAAREMVGTLGSNIDGMPVLDLVILGMGEDGHIASLFPGQESLGGLGEDIYKAVEASKPPPRRITLGYGAIIAARAVWVLVPGVAKREALRRSLSGNSETPLAKVVERRNETVIYTDIVLDSDVKQ